MNNSTSVNQTTTPSQAYVLPDYGKWIFYVVQCLLVLIGICGNTLVVFSVLFSSYLKRSISNLFIANLAVSDIFVLVVSHSFILGMEMTAHLWPFGYFACKALYPFSDSFYGISIWSIVVISYNRYCGIVYTMRSKMSRRKARLLIVAIWFLTILLVTAPLWFIMKHQPKNGSYECFACYPNLASRIAYLTTLTSMFYVVPFILIVFFYVEIRFTLKKNSGFHREMTKSQNTLRDDVTKRIRSNTKALRILTPVVIVFFVTMLPISLFRLLIIFEWMKTFKYAQVVFYACVVCLVANSSANPIIYSIVSPEFRRSFLRCLGLRRLRRGFTHTTEPYLSNIYSHGNSTVHNEPAKDINETVTKKNEPV